SAASSVLPASLMLELSFAAARFRRLAQFLERREFAQPSHAGLRGKTGPACPGRNIADDTRTSRKHCARSNRNVVGHTHLSSHDDAILDRRAAGYSNLRDQH